MKHELTGDEPEVFSRQEQETITNWQAEELAVSEARQAGVPPWQLTPLERLPAGSLTIEQFVAAKADPERMTLAELAGEEARAPLLKSLREGGGPWLQEETLRRLDAIGYWIQQTKIAAVDASAASE